MIVRELKPEDFDELVATFFTYFEEAEEDPGFGLSLLRQKPTMEEERLWFSKTLKDIDDGSVIMMVAEADSHIVGNCVVRRVKPKSPEDHRGNLGISVRKDYRGKGIGEALMKATIEKCRGKFEVIELSVLAHNRRAKRLYEKLGFRTYGTMKYALKRGGRYYADDLMYLKL